MKITIKQLLDSVTPLNEIITLDFPVKYSFRLAKLAKSLTADLEMATEKDQSLISKYGTQDEENEGQWKIDQENIEEFSKQRSELMSEEIEIDFEPISLSDVGDISIKPKDLMLLDSFFVE